MVWFLPVDVLVLDTETLGSAACSLAAVTVADATCSSCWTFSPTSPSCCNSSSFASIFVIYTDISPQPFSQLSSNNGDNGTKIADPTTTHNDEIGVEEDVDSLAGSKSDRSDDYNEEPETNMYVGVRDLNDYGNESQEVNVMEQKD